jgi:hypothetical protein
MGSAGVSRLEPWSIGVLRQRKQERLTQVENVKSKSSNDKEERAIGLWIWDFDIHLTFGFRLLAFFRPHHSIIPLFP